MKITENTTKEELLTNGYLTLHQFGQEMKTMIRRNAKEMGKKLAYKREMENMYYKNIEKSGEQFNFSKFSIFLNRLRVDGRLYKDSR